MQDKGGGYLGAVQAPAPGLERIAGEAHAVAVAAVRRRRQEPPERVATAGRRKPDMSGKPDKRPK